MQLAGANDAANRPDPTWETPRGTPLGVPSMRVPPWETTPRGQAGSRRGNGSSFPQLTDPSIRVSGAQLTDPSTRVSGM